jgi:hypothetical protein
MKYLFIAICFISCSPNFFTNRAKKYEPYNFTQKIEIQKSIDTSQKFVIYRDTTIINFNTPQQKTRIVYTPVGRDTSIIYINAITKADTTIKKEIKTIQQIEKEMSMKKYLMYILAFISVIFTLLIIILIIKK